MRRVSRRHSLPAIRFVSLVTAADSSGGGDEAPLSPLT